MPKYIHIMKRQKLIEHRVANLYWDEATSSIDEIWKPSTKNMADDDFKEYQLQKIKEIKKYPLQYHFVDTRHMLYPLSEEMQKWIDEVVMTVWDTTPLKKIAFVASAGLVAQMSIELAMDESPHSYAIQYFETEEEARAWMLQEA